MILQTSTRFTQIPLLYKQWCYSCKSNSHYKDCYKGKHNSNYFDGVDNFPVGIQNSYLDKDEEVLYVTSSGLPNYPIFATDNKVFVKTRHSRGCRRFWDTFTWWWVYLYHSIV